MKRTILIQTLLMSIYFTNGQTTISEAEIRTLEEKEHIAMLKRDTIALNKYWADDFIVNTPANRITLSKRELFDLVRAGIFNYSSFTREIEQIFIKDNVVITMGKETVKPIGKSSKEGQVVKRRYTNIWMKHDGTWKLTARHANEYL